MLKYLIIYTVGYIYIYIIYIYITYIIYTKYNIYYITK